MFRCRGGRVCLNGRILLGREVLHFSVARFSIRFKVVCVFNTGLGFVSRWLGAPTFSGNIFGRFSQVIDRNNRSFDLVGNLLLLSERWQPLFHPISIIKFHLHYGVVELIAAPTTLGTVPKGILRLPRTLR